MLPLPTTHRRRISPAVRRVLMAALVVWLVVDGTGVRAAEGPESVASEKPKAPSPYLRQLAEYELQPTTESLGQYLRSLNPVGDQRAEIDALIQQMGDPRYERREAAMRSILLRPGVVKAPLEQALTGDNAEIRWRAKEVLQRTERESRSLLFAVLTTIEKEPIAGLAEPLLNAAPHADERYLTSAIGRALAATASKDDVPVLREKAGAQSPTVRILALEALGQVDAESAAAEALPALDDADPQVQLAAARVLASQGRRESLAVLVRLLTASDAEVRAEAFRVLHALTGEKFDYRPHAKAHSRAIATMQWNRWLAESSATAPLKLPLAIAPIDFGRILVCDFRLNRVLEYDLSGKEIWQHQVPGQPMACRGLSNGHRLIGSYAGKCIIEFDEDGKEVWRIDDLPGGPAWIERLENGHTLVACSDALQVVEYAPDKSIVWKATLEGRPVDARRLENGNTLVALQQLQKVVEVDSDGKIVWELLGTGPVFSAQRLPDGNTLVASVTATEVVEYDPQGERAWTARTALNPYMAQRLADGNTLIVDRTGVHEIDPKGNRIRSIPIEHASRAWRY